MKKEIVKMLDAFMANSFLVPPTHTDFLCFSNMDEQYKTYSNEGRDYFCMEIKKDGKLIHSCTASKHGGEWSIAGANLFTAKTVKMQLANHYKYIKAIYEEIHCLNPDKGRLKEIRKEINEKREGVRKLEKEIEVLKKQLEDSKNIKK